MRLSPLHCPLIAAIMVLLIFCPTTLWAQSSIDSFARSRPLSEQLSVAILYQDLPYVQSILSADPTLLYKQDKAGEVPLTNALGQYLTSRPSKNQIIQLLINKDSVNKPNSKGETPLQVVVRNERGRLEEDDQIKLVQLLLNNGADLTARDKDGNCAIHFATDSTRLRLLNFLLDHGEDINARNLAGNTLLHLVSYEPFLDLVKLLLTRKANPNLRNDAGQTALHLAVYNNSFSIVKLLLDAGADVNARTNRGDLPIHFAMRFGVLRSDLIDRINNRPPNLPQDQRSPFLALLLDKGAHSDISDQFGLTPMLFAIINHDKVNHDVLVHRKIPMDQSTTFFNAVALDDVEAVKKSLKSDPAIAFFRVPTGTTALHIAALWNSPYVARLLLKAGVSPNARDAFAQTPLHYACSDAGNAAVTAVLLKAGTDPDSENDRQETPLHLAIPLAVSASSNLMVRLLLTYHANPNLPDIEGDTPLHIVCRYANNSPSNFTQVIARSLLEAGADPNKMNNSGYLPLSMSLPVSMMRLLLAYHASPNNPWLRISPLEAVFEPYSRFPIIERAVLLLDAGANPNGLISSTGRTILEEAIRQGQFPLVAMLIEKGADVNLVSPGGQTSPLIEAINLGGFGYGPSSEAQKQKEQIISLLVSKGADVNFHDEYNRTPLSYVSSQEKTIGDLLKQHGAK